jgi:rsbT co-antagonist protein RsbR
MKTAATTSLADVIRKNEPEILADWLKEQAASPHARRDQAQEAELRTASKDFITAVREALMSDAGEDIRASGWSRVRDVLNDISASRATRGHTPTETAVFVFSLKQPLFTRLRKDMQGDALADAMWSATLLIDRLGLYTTEAYQKTREEVIQRQQRELLELSTPVVQLWQDILALPLIGTLDSGRTQVVMESLLEKIVESGASIAIIDITGVPTVDTLVAQHLMKTVAAARLMGADCIISGIRPQIAQTIVHLGVDLSAVTTKASLADAFAVALKRLGARIEGAAPAKG